MPWVGFLCPVCSKKLSREEALLHLPEEHGGVVPAAIVEALWRGEESPRRADAHISPSMAGGCMREHAILRSFDIHVDPLRAWAMMDGTLYHEVLQKYNAPGWMAEVLLPEDWLEEKASGVVREFYDSKNTNDMNVLGMKVRKVGGVWEVELWPGLWFSFKLDQVYADHSRIIDYKTKNCPVGYRDKTTGLVQYNVREEKAEGAVILQQNIYGWGVRKLWQLDKLPKMEVWRLYKGIQRQEYAWQKYEVPALTETDLLSQIQRDYEMFIGTMRKVKEAASPASIGELPLQGLTQFGGKKCTLYCPVKDICDGLGGQSKWEF